MQKLMSRGIAAACASTALVVASTLPAEAQQRQEGLVNVMVGDITIQDIAVGVAAQIAANVCGVRVGPVAVLATQLDASDPMETVCETDQGDIILMQN